MNTNTYNAVNDYEVYQKNQHELARILNGAGEVVNDLNMSRGDELAELGRRVHDDTFKIMVTGTFKNGKSTLINAILGEDVLPAYALPCTAVINELKYGEEKKAVLYFRDPLPDPLPEQLAPKAKLHMAKYAGRPIPPLTISYDEIEDYVVIPIGADAKEMKLQSPFEKVEVFYPLDLLKNGVEIIDSPGLNEDATRTKVTMEYLMKVDAVLYVLNANAVCAGDEMLFVERDLKGNNFESVFFVVNRFDQISKREQPMIKKYAEMKIGAFYPQAEIFCTSAQNALDGKMQGDEELLKSSGLIRLELRLSEFLTKEKGRAKLAQPAKQVREILSREALEVVLPRERTLLDSSLEEVRQKYESIKPRLDALIAEKNRIQSGINNKIERSGRRFENMAEDNIEDIIRLVPEWVEECSPVTEIGLIPKKETLQQVVSEISGLLKSKITQYQDNWRTNVLEKQIEEEARGIFQSVEQDFSKIYSEIDKITLDINPQTAAENEDIPFWKRAAGIAGGFFIGDVGLVFSGGYLGIGKEFAMTAAFDLGCYFLMGLLGILNPFMIVAVIAAEVFFSMKKNSKNIAEKLKKKVKEEVIKQLEENKDRQAQGIADGIQAHFHEISDLVVENVTREIEDIDKQMKAAMEELEQGRITVDERKKQLEACEKRIYTLNSDLDTLIFGLIGA